MNDETTDQTTTVESGPIGQIAAEFDTIESAAAAEPTPARGQMAYNAADGTFDAHTMLDSLNNRLKTNDGLMGKLALMTGTVKDEEINAMMDEIDREPDYAALDNLDLAIVQTLTGSILTLLTGHPLIRAINIVRPGQRHYYCTLAIRAAHSFNERSMKLLIQRTELINADVTAPPQGTEAAPAKTA